MSGDLVNQKEALQDLINSLRRNPTQLQMVSRMFNHDDNNDPLSKHPASRLIETYSRELDVNKDTLESNIKRLNMQLLTFFQSLDDPQNSIGVTHEGLTKKNNRTNIIIQLKRYCEYLRHYIQYESR